MTGFDHESDRRFCTVIHFIPSVSGGGAERQLLMLAAESARLGHRIAVLSKMSGREEDQIRAAGVMPFPLIAAGSHSPAIAAQAVRAVKTMRADIIQTWLPQMDVIGALAGIATGVPTILSERSSGLAYRLSAKNFLRRLAGWRATSVVANSQAGAELWKAHRDVNHIANALAMGNLDAADPARATIPDGWRKSGYFVAIGRLSPEKNLAMLLRAFAAARGRGIDQRLVLVGAGVEESALRATVASLGITDAVLFSGFQARPEDWAKGAIALISPSMFEGHPNSVLEAGAMGVPLIVSDIPAHRDAIGSDAVYFQPDDEEKLTRILVDWPIHDKKSPRPTVLQSRLRELEASAMTQRYLGVYAKVMARR